MSVFNIHSKNNLLNIFIMKNLKNLGKALTNAEQKTINGGKTQINCQEHSLWCSGSHQGDFDAYIECYESCGC